ncbi:MAG: hypothetical protein ACUVQ8_04565 [Nitrososphaeria archaeon]
MNTFLADFVADLILATGLFFIILFTVFATRRLKNVWINRKMIHLSVTPAVLSYMYIFKEPYVFFLFGILFTLILIIPHLRSKELVWFQEKKNYGEVFFCVSFSLLSILFWNESRILTGVAMLFMAVGDSVTGIIRSRFLKKRGKHWTGTMAMLTTCLMIGYIFLGTNSLVLAFIATLAEFQPWLDDNLSVPIVTMISGLLMLK